MGSKKIRVAVSFTIIVVVLVWLVLSGFNENMQYFTNISDVQAMGDEAYSMGMRVKGFLVPGSLQRSANSLEVKFVIAEDDHEMNVRFAKELPDTFKDGAEVLVEGKYKPEGYFEAETLMAKCPSKYESDEYDVKNYDPSKYLDVKGTN